jgi:hypothetical protein
MWRDDEKANGVNDMEMEKVQQKIEAQADVTAQVWTRTLHYP